MQDAEILIIGAGMAGLTAARALAERGKRVLVVEARDRVGGRVLSHSVQGDWRGAERQMVELGAEFVHGRPPELWALIAECGAEAIERDGAMLSEEWDGELAEDDPQDDSMLAPLKQLEDFAGEDKSFAEWLAESDVPEDQRGALLGYVQGFNAADARRIGIKGLGAQQKAEDAIEGERAWHLCGGYQQLAEYLAARVKELGSEVRLHTEVQAVRWNAGGVEIDTPAGTLRAVQCILTLPLGVLQRVNAGGIRITPEPAAIGQARRLEMGHAVRFTMMFRERWWQKSKALDRKKLEQMSFLFTPQRLPSVWWTTRLENSTLLTGWIGGPHALALEGRSAGELGQKACAALAEVFDMPEAEVRTQLISTHTHDWSHDPFACGAYSYIPAGAMYAPIAMTQPELDTLFFAGEHTDTTAHWGTVHAAIRSGLRAAQQALGE